MGKRNLKTIAKSQDFSLYDASHEEENVTTLIASTPETRELTTNPFLVGKDYRDALEKAITKTLSSQKLNNLFKNEPDEKLNVLTFLRGGLNFPILDTLGSLEKNNARASFMSSERTQKDGRWIIRDDQYVKLNLEEESTLFIGDIIATGSTLKGGLAQIAERKIKLKRIVLFTLGCEESEKILQEYHKIFTELNPNYKETVLVYIEGCFHCPNEHTPVKIKITGTDLIPLNATLAPEFEQTLQENPLKALERCIVYDGGSRGFHPSHHFKDVLEYTEQLQKEINNGATAYDLIKERWEHAENLSQETKQKLNDPQTAGEWVKERVEKIKKIVG